MRAILCGVILSALIARSPANAQVAITMTGHGNTTIVAQGSEPAETAVMNQVETLLGDGKSADALPLFEQVIADETKAHAGEKRQIFCARSMVEAVLYGGLGIKLKRDNIVLGPTWADAIFYNGFISVDLGRSDEARSLFEQAIAMSPMNARYKGELAEWYRTHNDLKTAYATFKEASDAAEFSPDDTKSFDKRRALRGMAFILTDEGRLDEGEALYRQCLKLDPNDAKAIHELDYIQEQRAKKS